LGVRKKKGNKRGNGGILGWVMNTVEGGFLPPTQPPNSLQPVNAVQFEKCEIPSTPKRLQFYCCLGNVSRVIEF
jgi:hypothetical protein